MLRVYQLLNNANYMKVNNLHDLLEIKVSIIYDMEKQITKLLPKVIKKITSPELRKLIQSHLQEAEEEQKKIEKIFNKLHMRRKRIQSAGIKGMIEDVEWVLKTDMSNETRDAALISSLQYIEHYEVAAYGTARSWAEEMNHNEAAKLFSKTAKEEGMADKHLTEIAETDVNSQANEV